MNIVVVEETNGKNFNEIKIKTPQVNDLISAERIAGKSEGLSYALALISQVATFDGEKLPPEELGGLSASDFLKLSKALMNSGLKDLAKELSSSQSESPLSE